MESRAIAKAPEGEGCPRCGGFVYMAEQMLAKGRVSVTFFPLADHCTQITTSIRFYVGFVSLDRYGILLGIPQRMFQLCFMSQNFEFGITL